jgi:TetR/AcrR family transcriptional regulator
VLVELSPLIGQVAHPEALMDRPAEEALSDLARTFFSTFDSPTAVRLFRLLVAEVARRPEEGDLFAQSGIMVAVSFIADYLHRQVELGKLRPHDTRSSARAFLGSLVVYVMGRELFPLIGADPLDTERYVQEVVGIFLNGLRC